MERPTTLDAAVAAIRAHASSARALRPRGGGTKLGWGGSTADERAAGQAAASAAAYPGHAAAPSIDLDTRGLDRIIEHNAGDFTAVLEAGVRLADAQAAFARAGQMLALDPPLGVDDAATIGGIVATNDSGPLRHRYGGMRDLVIGMTVVLSDGTVAASGGKVIKNVAGYDLAKLFTGSFGTLGLIGRVAVRLHPLPSKTATIVATSDNPATLAAAVAALARLPLEADCLDITWARGSGRLLVRFAGMVARERAELAAAKLGTLGTREIVEADDALWADQRALQRAPATGGVVVKVAGATTDLSNVLRAADAVGATVVSRAALGLSWLTLRDAAEVPRLRQALAPRACTVLDGGDGVAEPWPAVEPGVLEVMRRVKARFDPARTFRPRAFVGGI